jgi:DNA-binding MarR family transcriptional regulator
MKDLANQQRARELLAAIEELDKVTGETSSLARYLLMLASRHPHPLTFAEIREHTGLDKSQVSRNTMALHKLSHRGKPGLDLIDVSFDIYNPRLKQVVLSSKGGRAMGRVLDVRVQSKGLSRGRQSRSS